MHNWCLHDHDRRIETHKAKPADSAQRVIDLAKAKGWSGIKLFGSPEYLVEAFNKALDAGLQVEAMNRDQETLFKKTLTDRGMVPVQATFGAPLSKPSQTAPDGPDAPVQGDAPAAAAKPRMALPNLAQMASRIVPKKDEAGGTAPDVTRTTRPR